MEITNNAILITGGSGGIGLELARQFLQLGNEVMITGRNVEKLEKIKSELPQIHIFQSDLRKTEEIRLLCGKVSRQFPKLNVLINNAGVGHRLNLKMQLDEDAITEEIVTNFQAPISLINYILPQLLNQPEAAIINVSSALAFSPFPIVPIYSASKAALHSYTLSLRQQLTPTSVSVFEIMPPTTQTEMLKGFSPSDLKGVHAMPVQELVSTCLQKIKSDQFEICPGQSKVLRRMSRIAPAFLLKQMSKPLKNIKKLEHK